MQISKYITPNYNIGKNERKTQHPSFKRLIIEPNIKQKISHIYHSSIDYLEEVGVKQRANDKFWNLEVFAHSEAPSFILQSMKHKNEYSIITEDIGKPVALDNSSKFAIPLTMFIPKNISTSLFKHKIFSNYDEPISNNKQTVYLQYDNMKSAINAYEDLCKARKMYEENLGRPYNCHCDLLYYPRLLVEQFENAYSKKGDIDEEFVVKSNLEFDNTYTTHIVRKNAKKVPESEKAVDTTDKKKRICKSCRNDRNKRDIARRCYFAFATS